MNHLVRVLRILRATLREIFDEASYARFLQRTNASSSPGAYAAYWREREASHARKPRCC
ncbi:MAG TPA: hypothetical protein VIH89_01665 [Candidatus Sulfotelmatobacter sp.]|jgi:hypothetical protein